MQTSNEARGAHAGIAKQCNRSCVDRDAKQPSVIIGRYHCSRSHDAQWQVSVSSHVSKVTGRTDLRKLNPGASHQTIHIFIFSLLVVVYERDKS